ncbi:FadR family transcriptional regulator [Mumia sp. ZJ1417]|uniref:FadR/GntR family transcriptional regulator n=1 Tax=Mumia sp. ZJ1417 TaxID=2708082 RepID=UPI001421B3BA|nr:FadR/GntR family transcriptional regulator [Mumia sp. ZJ1417]QMW66247.1 FadR family transcriptional regulator [Mumia sp. ZJ1417]
MSEPGEEKRLPAAALAVNRVKPAYQQVADQLRTLVLRGELVSGDRLPSEAEMVVHFGVSRSTVREALRVLSSQGLVETRRGVTGGTFVSDVVAEHVSALLEASLGLMTGRDRLSLHDMLEAREILEVPSARLAASRREDAHLAALRDALDRELVSRGREGRFVEHRTFHQVIVEAAQNPMLSIVAEPVFRVLRAQFLEPGVVEDAYAGVDEDHEAIFVAIAEQDAEEAARLMAEHLIRLRGVYRSH